MPRRPPAVAKVLERVTKTAREHHLFAPGDLILVSCSGGPDSVCLLYSLWYLRRLFRIRLAVFHFDHKLRPDSAKDAVYVRRLAERLKLAFHLRVASDRPERGVSVEAWATARRSAASNDVRREIGAETTAEGHTLDDQAETVLLNLIRGSGLEGMAGIDPGPGERARIVQPLLDVARDEVEAFCGALHLRPRRDPMNEDRRYLRAAIRHEVLPALEAKTGRGVTRSIVRTADLLRADRDELNAAAVAAYREIENERRGEVRFDARKLTGLPPPVASRVIRLAVYDALSGDWTAPWSKEAIQAVLDLAEGRPGRRRDLPEGLKAVREKGYVRVTRSSPDPRES